MRKNNLKLGRQFFEAVDYIKECRKEIYFVIAVFFAGILFGILFFGNLGFLREILRGLAEQTEGMNFIELLFFILQNNLQSAFLGLIFGIVFGIFPFFMAGGNGVVLGYVSRLVFQSAGIYELWRLFPHGIFELTAVFIALGMGVKFGEFYFKENRRGEFLRRAYNSMNSFLLVVLPLLALSAFLETLFIFIG